MIYQRDILQLFDDFRGANLVEGIPKSDYVPFIRYIKKYRDDAIFLSFFELMGTNERSLDYMLHDLDVSDKIRCIYDVDLLGVYTEKATSTMTIMRTRSRNGAFLMLAKPGANLDFTKLEDAYHHPLYNWTEFWRVEGDRLINGGFPISK